jgi:hypothetical protein
MYDNQIAISTTCSLINISQYRVCKRKSNNLYALREYAFITSLFPITIFCQGHLCLMHLSPYNIVHLFNQRFLQNSVLILIDLFRQI